MTDRSDETGSTKLDLADRTMLAVLKANLLGEARQELQIGRFRVLERLGEGSMGIVFAAMDARLKRRVALKLLHQAVGASEDERRARLLREAQILAQLEHRNIVQVYEAGEHEGQLYMVMELVEGQTRDQLQRTGTLAGWKPLLSLYVAAGHGLAAAHDCGVVHRDFKPQNVIVDVKGRVRVVDFGLARELVDAELHLTVELPLAHPGAIERPPGEPLTATGVVPGTPAYMAPELFDGQPASAHSDQFSFCVALYEALYGRRPFEGRRVRDVVTAAKQGRILPPSKRAVPRWLFDTLARGLAADPSARHPSMKALLAALERDRTRPWKRAGAVLAVGGIIGAGWWISAGDERAAAQRRQACADEVASLEAHWRSHADALAQPAVTRDDVDGLSALLDADAGRFLSRWESACVTNTDDRTEQCRAETRQAFEQVVMRGVDEVLPDDAFNDLVHELDLCLEGGESPSCVGPELGSPAVAALGDARAAELAGDREGALRWAREARALAENAGDELTRLRAMLAQGAALEASGEVDAAGQLLEQVLIGAVICDADVLGFDAARERAEAEILHAGRLEPAMRWIEHAQALLAKPSMPRLPLRQAAWLMRKGTAELYLQQDCVQARSHFEAALAQLEQAISERVAQALPAAHIERLAADTQLNLANVGIYELTEPSKHCQPRDVDGDEVVESLRAARARFAAAVSDPRHIGLLEYHQSLGSALLTTRDFEAASIELEQALSTSLAHYAEDSPVVADCHWSLAVALGEMRELGSARRHAERSLEIRRGTEGTPRLALAEAYELLGMILNEQGEPEAALQQLSAALDQLRRSPEPPLELEELQQLHELAVNMGVVELDLVELERGDVTRLRLAAAQSRAVARELAELMDEPIRDPVGQRLVDARISIADGDPRAALALLEGVEARSDFAPELQSRVDHIRRLAAGPD